MKSNKSSPAIKPITLTEDNALASFERMKDVLRSQERAFSSKKIFFCVEKVGGVMCRVERSLRLDGRGKRLLIERMS